MLFTGEQIDELGEALVREYLGEEADTTLCLDIEGFVTDFLGLRVLYRAFAEQDKDKIGFLSNGVCPLSVNENGVAKRIVYDKGTIVVEKLLRREHESGRRRFTISHEGAHYVMDRTIPKASFHREFDSERSYTKDEAKCLFSFKEAQIDRMGAAILMPRFMVRNVVERFGYADGVPIYGESVVSLTDRIVIKQMANTMGVSYSAFFIRLRELGLLDRRSLSEYIASEMGLGRTVTADE